MASTKSVRTVELELVRRLWFHRQGLARGRGSQLTQATFVDHLERCGALQLDTVNVLDRAHYLTLWSRFGAYDRGLVDRFIYRERAAFEHWGHEASVLPTSRLPHSLRHMRRFKPTGPWWSQYMPGQASIRRVLKRLREEGPLESIDFERQPDSQGRAPSDHAWGDRKEDKRALELLWFQGRVAISARNHFRRAYDLAERVYPEMHPASLSEYRDSWLLSGLSGNGIATAKHLVNYITAPRLNAAERTKVIERNLKSGRVVKLKVACSDQEYLARPEDLESIDDLEEVHGTTLICPFDSFLFQRDRALDLLDFHYRIEIYVPAAKRVFGYYVLPILHEGRLIGRLDPKLHRDEGRLELKSIHLEPGFKKTKAFERALRETLQDLATFVGAGKLQAPKGWAALAR
ncbi:MAG: hypothetical protein ACI835_002401 [Planctomycetota bacterium]|jgi:uncharacterized protein YcaQ